MSFKIVLVNTLYFPTMVGGAERSVQYLAEKLSRDGAEVTVITSNEHSSGVKVDDVNGVKVYYLPIKNIYSPFDGASKSRVFRGIWHCVDTYNVLAGDHVKGILKHEKPDVIHTNNLSCFSVSVWNAAKSLGIPIVHTLRDYYLMDPQATLFRRGKNLENISFLGKCVFTYMRRRQSAKIQSVVGNSKFILNKHVRNGYFKNANVKEYIYSCIDGSVSTDVVDEGRLEEGQYIVGYLGVISPVKGVDLLLDELALANDGRCKILLGGEGDSRYIDALNRKYEGVLDFEFLGRVDPREFFKKIDVLAVPSLWHEPLPRTIIEATAFGVPVVGANTGGIPEIIDSGVNGFVFNPDLSGDLYEKLSKVVMLISNGEIRADRISERAKIFDSEETIGRYMEVYEKTIKSGV
ncbi:MAG: glycosyl transferase [Gammaproteobacteria bacterium]|nr:MAG: glycosyl transferase [Gammaproteobacteria bacterium]